MKKRMIAMLLCVLMALSSMGGAVFAAEEPVTAEEPIAEEPVPSVDEFEVVDPHPLEGTVTEDVPEEAETPEIEELLPTEEPTAAETPAEEETEPEATEPAEDSMNSGILDMEEEVIVQMPVPSITVTPDTTFEELLEWAMLRSIPASSLPEESNDYSTMSNVSAAQPMAATVASYESYSNGPFGRNLATLTLDEGQLENMLEVAMIHIDYTDGQSANNLLGVNTSGIYNNYSVFALQYGIQTAQSPWNALFVNWCARQASIGSSIVPVNGFTDPNECAFGTMRTDFANIQRGDIIYIFQNNNYRVGIVLNVDDSKIYTIEGQRSPNQSVISTNYYRTDSTLFAFVSPNYLHSWDYINGGWYFRKMDGLMETGELNWNGHSYYLDPNNGGRMVTGWKQIDGLWYYFRPSKNDNGPQGSRVTGWVKSGSYWYYMDPQNNGAMVGVFLKPSSGRENTPIHSIPYSVAYALGEGH